MLRALIKGFQDKPQQNLNNIKKGYNLYRPYNFLLKSAILNLDHRKEITIIYFNCLAIGTGFYKTELKWLIKCNLTKKNLI